MPLVQLVSVCTISIVAGVTLPYTNVTVHVQSCVCSTGDNEVTHKTAHANNCSFVGSQCL